jgi:hypothetical protein
MQMINLFQRALVSPNNGIRAAWAEELNRHLEDERQKRRTASTYEGSAAALSAWIDSSIRPTAFVTLLLPFTPGYRTASDRGVRDHQFYLNLWTRKTEAELWGASALRIQNHQDRCLFLVVRETVRQDWMHDGTLHKFTHYHAPCRMPARPMLVEQERGMLPITERCALLQSALIEASKTTPAPYAKKSSLDRLRGADIQVQPYRSDHATYMFKQLSPMFREHWIERLADPLVRDHELFVLPHLPNKKPRAEWDVSRC